MRSLVSENRVELGLQGASDAEGSGFSSGTSPCFFIERVHFVLSSFGFFLGESAGLAERYEGDGEKHCHQENDEHHFRKEFVEVDSNEGSEKSVGDEEDNVVIVDGRAIWIVRMALSEAHKEPHKGAKEDQEVGERNCLGLSE